MSSHQGTPFIPAMDSPQLHPPVIPSPSGASPQQPAWASQPTTPYHYPVFSAYQGTPFIPSPAAGSHPVTPNMPGAYPPYVGVNPPAARPPPAVSLDYTGYPNFAPTPYAGQQQLPGSQPPGWPGPTSAPQAAPNTPWNGHAPALGRPQHSQRGIPPPVQVHGHHHMQMPSGYPPFASAGHAPNGWAHTMPHGALPFTPGTPYGAAAPDPFSQGAFTAQGWNVPSMTPGGWGPNPLPGGGPPPMAGGLPAAMGGPPPPMGGLARPTMGSLAREGDRMPKFSDGKHYGPVLEPFLIKKLDASIEINPLLKPAIDISEDPFIQWSMLFPPGMARRSDENANQSWMKGRKEPATFPRVTSLRLVFDRKFPWDFEVNARNRDRGVTCSDVLNAISENLHQMTGPDDYNKSPSEVKQQLSANYRRNRSRHPSFPGGSLGDGMRRLDWLGEMSNFAGLVDNPDLVKTACGVALPCTFVLRSSRNYPLTREEHEAQLRRAERRRSSSRNRPAMTVETVSDEDDSESEDSEDDDPPIRGRG